MFSDVSLMLDEFVPHGLFHVRRDGPQVRNAVDHVIDQVEAIQIIERRRQRAGREDVSRP